MGSTLESTSGKLPPESRRSFKVVTGAEFGVSMMAFERLKKGGAVRQDAVAL